MSERKRKKFWTRMVLLALVGLAIVACGPGPNDHSGGDETRAGAVPIEVGEVATGRLSRPDGDATDWKRFTVSRPGVMTIRVHWDNPNIEATVNLVDAFGASIERVARDRDERMDVIVQRLQDGDYFLELNTRSGASVYTIEIVSGEATAPGRVPGHRDPRPE